MRLLRSNNNKENIHFSAKSVNEKEKLEQLRAELKSAIAEITHLRDNNNKLIQKAQNYQKQLENQCLLREEIQFMKQQETNTKKQLLNLQQMNSKLRQQVEKLESENQVLKKQTSLRVKVYEKEEEKEITRRQSFVEETLPLSYRTNQRSFRSNSIVSDRHKSNHCSTPKSKMNINMKFEELIPSQMQPKRRVFL